MSLEKIHNKTNLAPTFVFTAAKNKIHDHT